MGVAPVISASNRFTATNCVKIPPQNAQSQPHEIGVSQKMEFAAPIFPPPPVSFIVLSVSLGKGRPGEDASLWLMEGGREGGGGLQHNSTAYIRDQFARLTGKGSEFNSRRNQPLCLADCDPPGRISATGFIAVVRGKRVFHQQPAASHLLGLSGR
ncbi:hypothetical protein BaRGS_00000557 [Batillaria attramentaria]|uniref:Uncharacterized protein n=1 Tax=Batillaria attramentaria TaxID=370345 RepID=A0ABD0MA00_9CAEN